MLLCHGLSFPENNCGENCKTVNTKTPYHPFNGKMLCIRIVFPSEKRMAGKQSPQGKLTLCPVKQSAGGGLLFLLLCHVLQVCCAQECLCATSAHHMCLEPMRTEEGIRGGYRGLWSPHAAARSQTHDSCKKQVLLTSL